MAEAIAKAYVQIIPTTEGITNNLTKELGGSVENAGKTAGTSFGKKLIGAIGALGVGAAIGDTISKSILAGGELEQSIGGIETLFKDSSNKVMEYANEAYKTAGLSANEYMQSVTGFSASLLQGLSGDTEKAADIANMALIDMSDNANKMGSSMESIQNAYQGFAKQNYTMLDNLKLGYGGTKQEMERLLADAEKLTGQKYDINNLADVYTAIHAIQGELDITGTTAKEASTTLQGAMASMKASLQNVLGNLALGEDITEPLKQLTDTATTFFVNNLAPMVKNIITAAPAAINTLLTGILPNIVPMAFEIVSTLVTSIITELPNIITTLISNLPVILNQVIDGLVDWWSNGLPNLLSAIIGSLPQILEAAYQALGGILKAMPKILSESFKAIVNIGTQLVKGLWQGIKDVTGWVLDKIKGFGQSILNGIKKIFGIASPSKEMAWMGRMLDQGLAQGIEKNIGMVNNAMGSIADATMQTISPSISAVGISAPAQSTTEMSESALEKPIIIQLVLDKKVIGETALNYNRQIARKNG